ncbi:MAG: hypothetical protein ABIS06_22430 [Vicinamibacterales bacterium]
MSICLRQALVLVSVTLFVGCQKSLPTAPGELASGIVIFEHANYLGASAHVTDDIKNLEDVKGPCIKLESAGSTTTSKDVWGDCISSIRVAPGWRATIYRDDGYSGDRLDVTADVPNLQLVAGDCSKGGFNDCISSIRLIRP